MRLLVDAHIFDSPTKEGVSTYIEGLYSAVIRQNSFIELYFVAHHIEKLKKVFDEHPAVHYIAYRSKNKYYRLAIELPDIIKRHKIDIAHFQYISPLFKCCREIVTTHDILFRDFPQYFPWSYRITKDFLFKRSARRADFLFTVSEYSRKRIAHHYKIDIDKIYITPDAVSERFLTTSTESLDKIRKQYVFDKYILFVSRLEPRKNHINLAKAYVELKLWEQGIKLIFVGKESIFIEKYHAYYGSLSSEIQSNIIHISQLTFNELLSIYKGSELFIYPSVAEGFGIPPVEAAAVGVPCLCANATAMSDFEFFGEGLFDPDNVPEIAKKIQIFFEGVYKPDTKQIQAIVREKYNWDIIGKEFLQKIIS
jgi:glycosyltransferase involved in cell wall biosynthesis